jgi:hypothetical protein
MQELSEQPKYEVVNFEDYAMTAETITRQVALIQDVMATVMKKDEHYGVIPGTGSKPSLLKPGAEKLSTTFRLAPHYEITRGDLSDGHREYEITCTLKHIPTNQIIGQGVGSCSTMESKFRYRKAEQTCPKCGKPTIIKGKKEYGGGWLCFAKKGGCGVKFKDGDPAIENQNMGRVEHSDPADYYNTVLKMAKKRAHVDAVLTATAASDIFTQDLEDLPKDIFTPTKPKKTPDEKPDGGNGDAKPATGPTYKKLYAALKGNGFDQDDCELFKDFLKNKFKTDKLTEKNINVTLQPEVFKKACEQFLEWEKNRDQGQNKPEDPPVKSSKDDMIHIGPDWALCGDEQCITLYKRRITNKGKLQWDPKGYYLNLEHALKRMIDMEINPITDLEDIVKGIDNLKKWLSESICGCLDGGTLKTKG